MTDMPHTSLGGPDTRDSRSLGDQAIRPDAAARADDVGAWTGWILFAAVVMVMEGGFHALQGLTALLRDGAYELPSSRLLVDVSYTTWGWWHLVVGTVVATAGVLLLTGRAWARVVAVLVAAVSAVSAVGFLSSAPVWGAIVVALDIVVIWAVAVHGGEVRDL
ncbi:MAG: DUF7144 family membrane protein [Motilibacteraceae bacterium]